MGSVVAILRVRLHLRKNAHDIVVQTHKALHFLNGSRRCVGAQEGIVALAVFVDLVGHRFDAPVFVFDDFAAVIAEDSGEMLD